jgi:hypothetical protein
LRSAATRVFVTLGAASDMTSSFLLAAFLITQLNLDGATSILDFRWRFAVTSESATARPVAIEPLRNQTLDYARVLIEMKGASLIEKLNLRVSASETRTNEKTARRNFRSDKAAREAVGERPVHAALGQATRPRHSFVVTAIANRTVLQRRNRVAGATTIPSRGPCRSGKLPVFST